VIRTGFSALLLVFSVQVSALVVVDDQQRQVSLVQPAQRIVALAPHVVENLFAVGLGARIVGAVAHSDYPEDALAIPRVGGYSHVNREAILALHPDLVITWGSGISQSLTLQLEAIGIPVYVSEPSSLAEIHDNLKDFALMGGIDPNRVESIGAFKATIGALAARPKDLPDTRSTVFYQIWHQPMQTLNGEHLVSEIFTYCGLVNVFHDLIATAPTVSIEAVLRADPDIIIASGIDQARPSWLDAWAQYKTLTAVQNKTLFAIDPDLLQRPTPRILQGLERVCEIARRSQRPNADLLQR
jgi:iron complex transport system substrate-binding protein